MKLKKFKKAKKSQNDPVTIIYSNIYSKYKTKISNYNIAQINSIIFNYSIPNSTQIISVYYKEMIILCDSAEYIKYKYSLKENHQKLKLFGYIYFNNFRPPPNYLSIDNFNRNIMLKLLIYKQELIDRYNFYMKKKENMLGDENEDYEDNYINLKPLYDSSDDKKTNVFSKKSSSKNKPKISSKNIKLNIKKNVHFSKDHFNLKSYISAIDDESKYESKYESKLVSKYMEPYQIKEDDEEKNENSIDSVIKLMDYFKNKEGGDTNFNKSINHKKIYSLKSNKNNSSTKIQERSFKRGFTGEFSLNQNKIINLLKNFRKNFGITNKYYLSLEIFKEKLQKNNKLKDQLEKYWKINKNFVTNLIENKNLKIKNRKLSPSFNYTLEDSISKNLSNNYFNLLSLSPKSKISSITYNSKLSALSLKSHNNNNNFYNKYKLNTNTNTNINKNKCSNSVGDKKTKNSLLMKIRNNSDFMKNKNFYCVFPKFEKSIKSIKLINKSNSFNKINTNRNIAFSPFNKINNTSFSPINRNNSFKKRNNRSNKFDYFGTASLSNENRFF